MSKWTVKITREMVDEYLLRTAIEGKADRVNFYTLVEEQIAKTLGEVVTYNGFLIIVRDGSPQCHFALGSGRQIPFYGQEPEQHLKAMGILQEGGSANKLDRILPWKLTFNYTKEPRDIVFRSPKGYVKTYHPGQVRKLIWPECPHCGKKLGMYNKDSAPGYSFWMCDEHGDITGVGMDFERDKASGTVVDDVADAQRFNRYEAAHITHESPALERIAIA